MKFLIVCFAIVVCVNAGGMDADMKKQVLEMMHKIAEDCSKAENASPDDMANIMAKKLPTTREGLCVLACMNENVGMQSGGKMSMEGAMQTIEIIKEAAPEIHQKMESLFKKCFPETESLSDRCDVAGKFAECGCSAAKEMGIEDIFSR